MKGSGFVRIVMVVMFIAGCAHAMAADRSVYKRLASTHREYSSTIDNSSGTSDTYYNYIGGNSLLLSSMVNYTTSNIEGDSSLYYNVQGTVTIVPFGRQVEYTATRVGAVSPNYSYMYVLDSIDRVVYSRHTDFGSTPADTVGVFENYRHYNNAGYADSLYFRSQNGGETFESCCLSSFNSSMLTARTTFYWNENQWEPMYRYVFRYPDNPVVLPEFIGWDSIYKQTFFDDVTGYEEAFNPKVIPSAIEREGWNGSSWQADDYEHYSQSLNGDVVEMAYGSQVISGGAIYQANLSGDFVSVTEFQSLYGTAYSSRTTNFDWDTIALSNDEDIIEIEQLPCAYPNPFNTYTKIRIENGTKSGANVKIYNLRGQIVREFREIWGNEVYWDGKDERMQPVPRGVYLVKYEEGQKVRYGKLMRY